MGSMQFTEKMLEIRDQLNKMGHDAFVTDLHAALVGKSDNEKEKIKLIDGAELLRILKVHGIRGYLEFFDPLRFNEPLLPYAIHYAINILDDLGIFKND